MMRWNTFARSILFAALAAGFALPWLVLARPIFGGAWAIVSYLVFVVAAYLGGLAPERRRGIAVFVVAVFIGVGVALAASAPAELALGLGALLAVGRSGFLYRAPTARAVLIETVLVGGGLVFARFLAGHSPLSLGLALWGFFLVQSFFFLVGGIRVRGGGGHHPDPFQDAYGRALALLDRSL
jgi:hypothetical protein